MKTYQDFVAVGEDEKARMSFILGAINEYKADHSTCRLLCRYTITIASTGWRHTGSNAGFTLCQPCVGAINKATSGVLTASHNIRLWRFLAWERRKASRIKRCLKKAFGRHWQGLNPVRFCGMANALKNLTGTLLGFSHIISE